MMKHLALGVRACCSCTSFPFVEYDFATCVCSVLVVREYVRVCVFYLFQVELRLKYIKKAKAYYLKRFTPTLGRSTFTRWDWLRNFMVPHLPFGSCAPLETTPYLLPPPRFGSG